MTNRKPLPAKLASAALWLILPLFAACGGGGGGSPPPTAEPPEPVVEMGVFIDSPVQGLTYQSGTNPTGITTAEGIFDYTVGETLTFSLGGVELGTLPDGKALVTPNDFGDAAENIARLLQTLDADGEHINGIDLTAASTALADTTFDAAEFTADRTTFETAIQPVLDVAVGAGASLIDADIALANLAAALDSTFEVAELAGTVFIVDLPSADDGGIAVFDPLADAADTGSSVTMFMRSDTIDEGGDGTTTVLDWSVDDNGILSVTDPIDDSVITIEKVGGSLGIISLKLTQDTEELVGSFLTPGNGVAMDLTGEEGRSYNLSNAFGNTMLNFYPDGHSTRVMNETIVVEDWTLDESGSLLTIADRVDQISLTVLLSGSLAVGGETMTFAASNLSGDQSNPVYQLDQMIISSLIPMTFPDPVSAIPYDFATSATPFSPQDPILAEVFTGAAVTGSFRFANWVPPIGVLRGPALPGAAIYIDILPAISGSAAGMNFADAGGLGIVGNDRFQPNVVDFLSVAAISEDGLDTTFEAAGYTLTNVRLFWIEGSTTPDDFLQNDLLPAELPVGVIGRLALDFELTADPLVTASVFFEDLSITVSP
jgi:hypothetical protein